MDVIKKKTLYDKITKSSFKTDTVQSIDCAKSPTLLSLITPNGGMSPMCQTGQLQEE